MCVYIYIYPLPLWHNNHGTWPISSWFPSSQSGDVPWLSSTHPQPSSETNGPRSARSSSALRSAWLSPAGTGPHLGRKNELKSWSAWNRNDRNHELSRLMKTSIGIQWIHQYVSKMYCGYDFKELNKENINVCMYVRTYVTLVLLHFNQIYPDLPWRQLASFLTHRQQNPKQEQMATEKMDNTSLSAPWHPADFPTLRNLQAFPMRAKPHDFDKRLKPWRI